MGPICASLPNFIKIDQTVGDIWLFNGFLSKWRPSAILDLSGAYWDNPRRLLGGLYRCAKFGWNLCSTFDNMKVLIFCAFCLKTPIHAPKIGVLGGISPLKWGAMSTKPPKGTSLRESASFEPSRVKIRRRVCR